MKQINKKLAIILLGLFTIFSSCEKTEEDPTVSDRDKFIGTWDGESTGPGGPRNFNLVISASNSAPDQIKMQDFDGGSGIVFATVNGNSLSIPSQVVGSETIEGSGTYLNGEIDFTFSLDDGQQPENRTATATNRH